MQEEERREGRKNGEGRKNREGRKNEETVRREDEAEIKENRPKELVKCFMIL